MKEVKLLTVSALFLSAVSMGAQAAFLIDEGGGQQPAKPAPTRRAVISSPPAAPVESGDPTFGQMRTFIKHKGRKPAVFGKPVLSQSSTTLSSLVVDVMPDQFQAFASPSVDMGVSVRGGKADNWVTALSGALRETDYVATVDWDKREVLFDVNDGSVEPRRAPNKVTSQKMSWNVNIKDGLLSRTLSRWCAESGGECVRFINQASNDMEIDGGMVVTGDFRSAVGQLMSAVKGQVGAVFQWKIATNKILILSDDPSAAR